MPSCGLPALPSLRTSAGPSGACAPEAAERKGGDAGGVAREAGEAAEEGGGAVGRGGRARLGAVQGGERAVGGEDHRQAGGGHRAEEVGEGGDLAPVAGEVLVEAVVVDEAGRGLEAVPAGDARLVEEVVFGRQGGDAQVALPEELAQDRLVALQAAGAERLGPGGEEGEDFRASGGRR